ncbi:uncharacterized protein N7484_006890 [Penicillium longicatenatum]|uniref:uncharacterized protein n=1 Tax=Penicillium longicatenatum TaxID=1561947 RepID=UPI0025475A05|nr:uncharacterized protein N7484_006890 [Penicillium longicatenatum]KAJ5639028.1 hypothetical protein N7484_006890 [Penicillium longicatenatum]
MGIKVGLLPEPEMAAQPDKSETKKKRSGSRCLRHSYAGWIIGVQKSERDYLTRGLDWVVALQGSSPSKSCSNPRRHIAMRNG